MTTMIHIQVSDVLCYKLIPIIYRTLMLQNSLKDLLLSLSFQVYSYQIQKLVSQPG